MIMTGTNPACEFGSADEPRSRVLLAAVGLAVMIAIYAGLTVSQVIGCWVSSTAPLKPRVPSASSNEAQPAFAA